MANKAQTVTKSRASYTRNHFAALRAFVQRVPAATIARLYFSEDEDGSARLTAVTLKMVEQAALLAVAKHEASHGIGMVVQTIVARRLKAAGIGTLTELVDFCNQRGGSWWRAIPRIGPGRAQHIVSWLRQNETLIGLHVAADISLDDPFSAPENELVMIGTDSSVLAPLERVRLPSELSGASGPQPPRQLPVHHGAQRPRGGPCVSTATANNRRPYAPIPRN